MGEYCRGRKNRDDFGRRTCPYRPSHPPIPKEPDITKIGKIEPIDEKRRVEDPNDPAKNEPVPYF